MQKLRFLPTAQRRRKYGVSRIAAAAPRLAPGVDIQGDFMVCYQVLARFVFCQCKPALVSTNIKKQKNAPAHLVLYGLPFGHGLKYRRFFHTKKEAARYVLYLRRVYKNRIVSGPAYSGGQLSLF
jgi:hypothetical protein